MRKRLKDINLIVIDFRITIADSIRVFSTLKIIVRSFYLRKLTKSSLHSISKEIGICRCDANTDKLSELFLLCIYIPEYVQCVLRNERKRG